MAAPVPLDALAIGAHPDDAELQAGGTLLRLHALGYTTGIVSLTRGERASRGTPEQRALESIHAGHILKVSFNKILDFGDSCLEDSMTLRLALVTLIRQHRPRVVLSHHRDEPHPDHACAARAVQAAVHLSGLGGMALDLPAHRPHALLQFALLGHRRANIVVDISTWAERKHAALRHHRSQFGPEDPPTTPISSASFLEDLALRERFYGSLIGSQRGEGFAVDRMLSVEDPVRMYADPVDHFSG